MLYILYQNSGVHSGRALRRMLQEQYEGSVLGGFPSRLHSVVKKHGRPEVIINLGTTVEIPYKDQLLNSEDMVRAASNKKRARVIFQDADVPAPRLYTQASQVTTKSLPVIGRTSFHKKGKGFWFCKTKRDVQDAVRKGATHFLSFIDNTREYRVHLFSKTRALGEEDRCPEDYVSIKIAEKVWRGKGVPDPKKPQKNHEFGWVFLGPQNRREEELDVVRYAAKQAIAALGLDFGAVDVMYRIRNKEPYVLEVNSTPSLADEHANTCEVYANRFMKAVRTVGED